MRNLNKRSEDIYLVCEASALLFTLAFDDFLIIELGLHRFVISYPDGTRGKRVTRSDFVDGVLYLEQLYLEERDIYQRPQIQAYDSKGRAIGKMD